MNRLSGRRGRPAQSLRGFVIGLAVAMSACTGARIPQQLASRAAQPPPGLAELHRAALEEPTSPRPHLLLAELYLGLGNAAVAEQEARTAVALAPKLASAYAVLATVLVQGTSPDLKERFRRLEEASGASDRALEISPDDQEYLLLASNIALELGQVDVAEARLNALPEQRQESAAVVIARGRLAARRHQYQEAHDLFARAVGLENNHHWIPLQAWAAFLAGDEAHALALYDSIPESYLGEQDRVVLTALALRRDALAEAEAQLHARYHRAEDANVLAEGLERLERVKAGRLKASALADLTEAQLAQDIGDLDRAELLLRRALEVDRRIPEAPEMLAELQLFVRRDPRQALKVLSDAPEQTVSYRRFHLYIQAYRALQDALGAQEVLREFLEFVAQDVENGRREDARAALETMVLLLPVPSLWQFLVDLAVEDEDLSGLMASWEQLRATVPRLDVQFTTITGEALMRLGRLEQAEQMLRQALLKEPTNHAILLQLGVLAEKRGDELTAEEVYRRMTVIHPHHASSWIRLGQHYLKERRAEDARGAFEEALRREEGSIDALTGLAKALSLLKLHDGAITAARKLTEVDPDNALSWLELARTTGEARRFAEQEHALRQAIMHSQDAPETWDSLARFLIQVPDARLRRVEEAVAMARRAVENSQERNPAFLGTLAEALFESGRYAEALKTIDQAIQGQPEFDNFHRQRRKIRNALESATPARYGM